MLKPKQEELKQDTEDKSKEKKSEFAIQQIYVKDLSYEAPKTPHSFRAEWKPIVNLDLNTRALPLGEGVHEVVLSITTTVKIGENTAFLVEIQQAGIFMIKDFPEDQMQQLLWSYCPSVLFPYAREVVSDLITRGGFPPIYLAPINFEALYEQHMQRQAAGDGTKQH